MEVAELAQQADHFEPPLDELDAFELAAERLVASECDFGDPDTVLRLERVRTLVEYKTTKAIASFTASGAWADCGARSPKDWLTKSCHVASADAARQVRRGRALVHMPNLDAAWSKGLVTPDHIDVMGSLRNERTKEVFERDEEVLTEQAVRCRLDDFVGVGRYWEQLADPDGADAGDMARRARRDAYLVPSADGMFFGKMTLDPISGAIVSSEHQRLERELFEADWAAAKETLGRDPKLEELSRTGAQRRADAFVEMATRSKMAPADGRRPEPLFSVLVGYETLHGRICELAQGAVVAPGSLLPWLEQADFERAVFAPGKRIEVSITSRFFTGATRRAIELRDRVCQHPYCNEPAERCQADHIIEYSKGGPTCQENGRMLCGFHNRQGDQRPPPRE